MKTHSVSRHMDETLFPRALTSLKRCCLGRGYYLTLILRAALKNASNWAQKTLKKTPLGDFLLPRVLDTACRACIYLLSKADHSLCMDSRSSLLKVRNVKGGSAPNLCSMACLALTDTICAPRAPVAGRKITIMVGA